MAHEITANPAYVKFVQLLIVVYTGLLISASPEMTAEELQVLRRARVGLLALVFCDLFLRFRALKNHFLRDAWNKLDFALSCVTFLGYLLQETKHDFLVGMGDPLVCTLSFRLLRVARASKLTRIMIDTFVITFPSILNVGSLLLLIIYVYAILGTQLFAQVQLQDGAFNVHANF